MSIPRMRHVVARGVGFLFGLCTVLGVGVASAPAASANSTVCNIHCDARDPALAKGDRRPVSATVFSRRIVLHVSDPDDMTWASIEGGSPTDEVWLDRSWDGGQSWSDGSKLGDTFVPNGQQGWRTLMYNVDDPSSHRVGAVRACGRAGNRPAIACTSWARSSVDADTSAAAGATALMQFYSFGSGNWPSGWWQSANALTATIDYMTRSRRSTYSYVIAQTFNSLRNAHGGNFTNEFLDDTGWWGLAWTRAYDYTGNHAYLQMAETDADHMARSWNGTCGGGVWWTTPAANRAPYKNAITNELYLKLNAALHNRLAGDTLYLGRARAEWSWFRASGMINSQNLVNDGLNSSCANNRGTTWTYNQGVVLGGLAELYTATGDGSLLATAGAIANAATSRLTVSGILVDPCSASCGGDGSSFKGIFVRNLYELARKQGTSAYNGFMATQANSIMTRDSNSDAQCGYRWEGPLDSIDYARQQSCLDALNTTL
jgi:predicted alpha-1,6-mannanase (GH76 family)